MQCGYKQQPGPSSVHPAQSEFLLQWVTNSASLYKYEMLEAHVGAVAVVVVVLVVVLFLVTTLVLGAIVLKAFSTEALLAIIGDVMVPALLVRIEGASVAIRAHSKYECDGGRVGSGVGGNIVVGVPLLMLNNAAIGAGADAGISDGGVPSEGTITTDGASTLLRIMTSSLMNARISLFDAAPPAVVTFAMFFVEAKTRKPTLGLPLVVNVVVADRPRS